MDKIVCPMEDLPEPMVLALQALSNKDERMILLCLLDRGELSYSEIHKLFPMRKGRLNYHLKKLFNAGLIRKYYKDGRLIGQPYHSYYEPTDLGRRLVNAILDVYLKRGPREKS